ncbi:unnamed protein product, partial [Ilex paraguariensis]
VAPHRRSFTVGCKQLEEKESKWKLVGWDQDYYTHFARLHIGCHNVSRQQDVGCSENGLKHIISFDVEAANSVTIAVSSTAVIKYECWNALKFDTAIGEKYRSSDCYED